MSDRRVGGAEAAAGPWFGHLGGLDGLRGLAVAAVVVYHHGYDWASAGFLGVSLFFTLSGFLITSLLLTEADGNSGIGLAAFWRRRFRRLLPASLVAICLAAVATAAFGTAAQQGSFRGDALGALGYVFNWRQITSGVGYEAAARDPSLLQHFWSLAIEEQFYVLFPLLAAVVLRANGPRREKTGGCENALSAQPLKVGRERIRVFAAVVAALAALSLVALVVNGGASAADRVYFGTDTRAFEILAGVGAAIALHRVGPRLRAAQPLQLAGLGALGLLGLWSATATVSSRWLYDGGFAVIAVASTIIIVAVASRGWLNRALGIAPLRFLGRISYGLYLYHWPVFSVLDGPRTGITDDNVLFAVRVAASLSLALASYHLIEQPIRRSWSPSPRRMLVAAGGAIAATALVGASVTGFADQPSPGDLVAEVLNVETIETIEPPGPGSEPEVEGPRALLLGDSLSRDLFPFFDQAIEREGGSARLIGGPSEGPLEADVAWIDELDAAIDEFAPSIVVFQSCCFGRGGQLDADRPIVLADGTEVAMDSDEMFEAHAVATAVIFDLVRSRGIRLAVITNPVADPNPFYGPLDERMQRFTATYDALVAADPDIEVIDWNPILAPDGTFSAMGLNADGREVRLRVTDGLHLTDIANALVAVETVRAIVSGS